MSNITTTLVIPANGRAKTKHFPCGEDWQVYAEYGDTLLHCYDDGTTVQAEYAEYSPSDHAYSVYERLFCVEEAPEREEVINELTSISDEVWDKLFGILTEE